MITTLLFDLGGVIMDIRRENAVEALQKLGLPNADDLLGAYGQKGIFLQLERGDISVDQFHEAIRPMFVHPVSDKAIDDAFNKFLLGIPVHRLHQLEELGKHYRICLLSNTNAIMWHTSIAEAFRIDGHDINHYFDGIIASFEVNAYKPDREIFDITCSTLGLKPSEILFYDDSAANVEAARALGFNAVNVVGDKPFAEYIEEATDAK